MQISPTSRQLPLSLSRGMAVVAIAMAGLLIGLVVLGMTGGGANGSGSPLIAVAGLVAFAAMAWYVGPRRRMFLGLLFLVAPFDLSKAVVPPLGPFHSPGLYLGVGHLALLGLALTWVFERVWVQRLPLPRTRLDTLALVYLGWIWVSALRSPGSTTLMLASAMTYTLCVLAFYVVSHSIRDESDVRWLLRAVVLAFALQAVHVLAQMATHNYLPLPGSKLVAAAGQVIALGDESAAFRPIGAFDHPNALADYLTLVLVPALALVLMGPSRIARRVWLVAFGVVLLGGVLLLLTLSRGSWLAFALAAIVLGVIYLRYRIIGSTHVLGATLLLALGVAAFVAVYPQVIYRLTEPDSRSTESRIVLTDQAVTIIESHPLMGVGFGSYHRAAHEITPPSFAHISADYQEQILKLIVHNHYLLVAAELGIPAMLFWCYLLWRMVRQAWPLTRWQDPGAFALGVGLSAALVSQMLFLASDNYYADIRVFMLWLTAGLLQAMTRLRPVPGDEVSA
jgi:O-antigen ligase